MLLSLASIQIEDCFCKDISLRATSVTFAPNKANSIADALPNPCVLPQTMAFLFLNLNSFAFPLVTVYDAEISIRRFLLQMQMYSWLFLQNKNG
jgi:hypothetical protein